MLRKLTVTIASLGLLVNPVLAAPGTLPAAADNSPVIYLGETLDQQSGRKVEGYAIIHYLGQPHDARGGVKGKPGNGGGGSDSCYAFLANGARWNSPEDYIVDPTNSRGLDEAAVRALLAAGVETWDSETAADVFGVEVAGLVDGADTSTPDGKNEVLFADVSSSGAIAVTIVWGVFRGPTWQRGLVEWDMVFDDVDFDWSLDGVPGKMDFLNIAVHELGHAAGMGHPNDSCVDETMYRYASAGETKKRDLNTGDIAGIVDLYN